MGSHHLRLFQGVQPNPGAVAALPVDSAVIDGEAVVFRPDNRPISRRCDPVKGRRRRRSWFAYDLMEAKGQDIRPEPLEERRKRLSKLLSRKTKADARRHPTQRRAPRVDEMQISSPANLSSRLERQKSWVTPGRAFRRPIWSDALQGRFNNEACCAHSQLPAFNKLRKRC